MIASNAIIKANLKIVGEAHHGIIHLNMIESALSSWHYYDSIEKQITSIYRGLVKNHAFKDGNKRTAVITLQNLCDINDINFDMSDDELFDVTIDVAKNKYTVEEKTVMLFGDYNINEPFNSLHFRCWLLSFRANCFINASILQL
jgi:death-on-curing protein